jgi:NAD(P)-dependent dehydrogenase (short-subunit alcohol dehydrogenase family)
MVALNGKVALVTGASSGIGRAAARALEAEGAVVYATARRPERLADLEAEGLRTLALDVTDEGSMAAVRAVEAEHGAVDVLVNNAGYMQSGALEEVGLNAVRDEFEVNVFGLLRMSQLVLPAMRERGAGRIVNVGSVGGLFTAPGAGAYHMSKYAVEALSDALRYEVKSFGVAVVLVQPTGVRTPFVETPTALIPENEGPYAAFNENYNAGVKAMFTEGARGIVSAEDVAGVIVEAAGAARPRARYKVGLGAHVFPRVRRLLGDRAWDAAMARQFPMTRREALARTAEVGDSTR